MAIVIDSGADVAQFPLNMAGHREGELEFKSATKLQAAQGNKLYPRRGGAKSVEISLRDIDGREVLLKENVVFSSKVNQPILSYGRLMEHRWGINGRGQTLENGDLEVPLNLQNRSLTVQGRIRVIRDEDESCLEAQVREALEKAAGCKFKEHGLPVGSLFTSNFVGLTFIPEVEDSPELVRTALVKRGGRWLMPEFCESVMEKEELDDQFFDHNAVIPSITIFSYEPVPPEHIWDSLRQDTRSLRT